MKYGPDNFTLEATTIWSFPDRGSWATHSGSYRGNWSPYIPRNLILRYSKPGNWILDQFAGSGTTLIEAKLLSRNAIGIDINPMAVKLARQKIDFVYKPASNVSVRVGDAQSLASINNSSIDMICTHPPYADIIRYSDDLPDDISCLNYDAFLDVIHNVAKESFRVLRNDGICAFMIGDIRSKGLVQPLGMQTMQIFIQSGFTLREIIIKEQHNCRSTDYWAGKNRSFLLLAHEYIFVLTK